MSFFKPLNTILCFPLYPLGAEFEGRRSNAPWLQMPVSARNVAYIPSWEQLNIYLFMEYSELMLYFFAEIIPVTNDWKYPITEF